MDASQQPAANPDPMCALHPERQCLANDKLDEILARLDRLNIAFPEDEFGEPDIVGHRRIHEKQIEAAEAEAAFWRNCWNKLRERSIWFVLFMLGGLLMTGILVKAKAFIAQSLKP